MNLSNLIEAQQAVPARAGSNTKNPHNVFYLPSRPTSSQNDFSELLIRLHKHHLLKQYGLGSGSSKVENGTFACDNALGSDHLSDGDLMHLLYSNLNLISNNPYLLVDHYIPKNMLLMNTKDSLTNISGKFALLAQIISLYEDHNNDAKKNDKYDVLVLANSSKELDFIESLLIGRFVNYKRYSGSKLFEYKKDNVVAFDTTSTDLSGNGTPTASSTSGSANSLKRTTSSKEDPYLAKRLKKQHKRVMRYISNNNFNHNYCLTVHLITINQLKFQFFTNKNPETSFDFLDLSNTINFNFILSFNNYLNLDNYYLKKIRAGYINKKTEKYQRFPEPLPIVYLLSEGSIEHVTVAVHDWLVKNKVINDNQKFDKKFIDERPSKYNLTSKDNSILLLIIKLFLVSRSHRGQELTSNDFKSFSDWFLQSDKPKTLSTFASFQKFPGVQVAGLQDFDLHKYLSFFKSHYSVSKASLNKSIASASDLLDQYLEPAINEFGLTFYDFNRNDSFLKAKELLSKNAAIYEKFSQIKKEYIDCDDITKQAQKEFGDATLNMFDESSSERPKKKIKLESGGSLLSFNTVLAERIIEDLDEMRDTYVNQKKDQLESFETLQYFPITLDIYKKSLTKLIKTRSQNLTSLNTVFDTKLFKENFFGNQLQLRMEKNNFVSKDLFSKQLELKKTLTKEEKIFERVFNEVRKSRQLENLLLAKIKYFESYFENATGRKWDVTLSQNHDEKAELGGLDKTENNLLEEVDHQLDNLSNKVKENGSTELEKDGDKIYNDSNDEHDEIEHYFDILNRKIELNDKQELVIHEDPQNTEREHKISSQTIENQKLIIQHLKGAISAFDKKSEDLAATTESSRSLYQTNSAIVSSQLEEIGTLDTKISAIKEVLAKKTGLFVLKEKALDFEIGESQKPLDIKQLHFGNDSNFRALKYKNLVSQKYFLENYMRLLKSCYSNRKDAIANTNGKRSNKLY